MPEGMRSGVPRSNCRVSLYYFGCLTFHLYLVVKSSPTMIGVGPQ